jgi:uncharacterized protein (DUF433 family)
MLNLPQLEVPLNTQPDGSVRINGSPILLEQVVTAFEGGVIADEIARCYPELSLSDVFLVLSFYLKHRKEVEDYLAYRQRGDALVKPKPAA